MIPPLPAEPLYRPFEPGPWRMAMGLVSVAEPDWFEIDALYPIEMRLRRDLLAHRHAEVFGAEPGSDPARREALAMVATALAAHHPGWFGLTDGVLHNHLTGEAWHLDAPGCDPLECAGRLVQEDLCLLQTDAAGPRFTAAVLCFPSRWRLHEKLGQPLAAVHGPVPFYADRLARPVDRFMMQLKDGRIAGRLNWSVLDSADLFQPTGKWRRDADAAITAATAGERLFLRVERQTLRRLPASQAILFGIRVHAYPLAAAVTDAASAGRLAAAVRALPEDMLHYKSMLPLRAALLAWLDARSGRGYDETVA
jgi:hypothetical protein